MVDEALTFDILLIVETELSAYLVEKWSFHGHVLKVDFVLQNSYFTTF